MLEWAGDVGGLYDGLKLSVKQLFAPLTAYLLRVM